MPRQLPLELLQDIIDQISNSEDLCTISLSCHSLRVKGQSNLFRHPTPSSIDGHSKFMDAILASPERLALLVRVYSQWLPTYTLSPWIPNVRNTSKNLHNLLRKTQSALPLMLNLKALYYRCPIQVQPTVFILRNCWGFQLETLKWDARAHDEELYRCFIPTQPELKHVAVIGRGKGAVDELDPIPLACPRLRSLCGRDRDIHILLPGKAITHLMWRADQSDDPWSMLHQEILDLAPELNSVQYFVEFHRIQRRNVVLRCMPNLTHLEIFMDDEEQYSAFTVIAFPKSLRVLVINKTGPHSSWIPDYPGDNYHYIAEIAFENCPSLRHVYVEDLEVFRQNGLLAYRRYQRQNHKDSDDQQLPGFDRVTEEEVHAWWMPHWSRYL